MVELAQNAPFGDQPVIGGLLLAAVFVGLAITTPFPFRTWLPPAQTDFERMIAYTSSNHMGYVVLAVGAAGVVSDSADQAREVAITGAVVQMMSHGLITRSLFLLAAVLYARTGSYDIGSYGGLAAPAPRYAALFAVAAFASLGLPGFSGFIAEFQIFAGSIDPVVLTALAFPGILITAALFLRALQRMPRP